MLPATSVVHLWPSMVSLKKEMSRERRGILSTALGTLEYFTGMEGKIMSALMQLSEAKQ